jgi:hypothetical protein
MESARIMQTAKHPERRKLGINRPKRVKKIKEMMKKKKKRNEKRTWKLPKTFSRSRSSNAGKSSRTRLSTKFESIIWNSSRFGAEPSPKYRLERVHSYTLMLRAYKAWSRRQFNFQE